MNIDHRAREAAEAIREATGAGPPPAIAAVQGERRRRTWAAAFVGVAVISLAVVTAVALGGPDEAPVATSPTTTTTQAASTAATSTPSTATPTESTVPSAEPPPQVVEPSASDGTQGAFGDAIALPPSTSYLVYGHAGLSALSVEGDVDPSTGAGTRSTQLTAAPTARAFAVGDIVVAQAADSTDATLPLFGSGPLHAWDGSRHRLIPADPSDPGAFMQLFDAGMLDGRPVALVSIRASEGSPATDEERLVLVDLLQEDRTDLGVSGWWEAGVEAAVLTSNGTTFIRSEEAGLVMIGRSLDGSDLWQWQVGEDTSRTLVFADGDVVSLGSRFDGDDFTPFIDLTRLDPATGRVTGEQSVELQRPFDGGFCQLADWDGKNLLCNESYGGPFLIDLASGTTAGLSDGNMAGVSFVRPGMSPAPAAGPCDVTTIDVTLESQGVLDEDTAAARADVVDGVVACDFARLDDVTAGAEFVIDHAVSGPIGWEAAVAAHPGILGDVVTSLMLAPDQVEGVWRWPGFGFRLWDDLSAEQQAAAHDLLDAIFEETGGSASFPDWYDDTGSGLEFPTIVVTYDPADGTWRFEYWIS